jgi:DNA-directed RNA polymerase subunit RPC12/RpoP
MTMGALTQFACTACGKTLKSPKPIPEGTKVKCPKCTKVFVVGNGAPPRRSGGNLSPAAPRRTGGDMASAPPRRTKADAPKKTTNKFVVLLICFVISVVFVLPPYLLLRTLVMNVIKVGGAVTNELPGQDLTNKPADFTLAATDFYKQAHDPDRETAMQKYYDKVVELSGKVADYGVVGNSAYLGLEGGKVMETTRCNTADREPWAKVLPGQEIKIKGRVTLLSFPNLVDCVIVDAGSAQPTTMTAEALTAEFAADKDATTQKYSNKYFILQGEVLEQKNELGVTLILKGTGTTRVKCTPPFRIETTPPPNRTGQQIKLACMYTSLQSGKDVEVINYELITK